MSSKLEYLQRYMSGGGSDVMDGDKKKKKKMKKSNKTKTALGTRVVDTDDTWELSAPSREDIEKKWELDAAEDEKPLVVGVDGEGIEDPQDLPVKTLGDEVKRKEKMKIEEDTVKKAGLFTADEFEHQRKIAAKKKDLLQGVDASEMGANAETVYRDKRGRKLDMLNEMVRQQEILDGKRKREEREEYEWGTGEVQKRQRRPSG
eukprot:jgi/Phyca11/532836/estExt2_fgenesh1_pg.C_PHYCAscaffold_80144